MVYLNAYKDDLDLLSRTGHSQFPEATMWDHLWLNISLMTMPGGSRGLGIVNNGALAVSGSHLAFAGDRKEFSESPKRLARKVHDGGGAFATPALIDCHTHLVYGGNRSKEFEARLDGTTRRFHAEAEELSAL